VGSQGEQNAEVIRTMFARVSAGNYEDAAELFAEDIEFDTPYAPDDYAVRVMGRSAVKNVLTGMGSTFERFVFEVDTTFPGADGETIVVEYRSSGTVKRNGKAYANRYVGILRVRDGVIVLWREYYNPAALTALS
jgi:ketosteroid isomerase-like protein